MAINVSFQCRPSRVNRLGTAAIEMCINDGKRSYVQMKLRCKPDDFQKAIEGKGFPEILEYVAACRKRVDTLIIENTKAGIPITAASLKAGFERSTGSTVTIGDLFAEYMQSVSKRLGNGLSKDTFKRYERAIKEFKEDNALDDTFPAKDIALKHFLTYQEKLLDRIDYTSARNYLQKIKSVFKYAFELGKIPANPSYGLKIDNRRKDTVKYLTEEEVEKIRVHNFNKRLREVADVFLFSCSTGLSYSDICSITPEDFKQHRGFTYINKSRKKTGIKFTAIVFEDALEIAEKYNYRLPVKSNQKMNAYLKEIATLTGIEKNLTFHCARHTAACKYLNHRPSIPIETIERIFGWTNQRIVNHYAKLFNATIFDDIENAFGPGDVTKPTNEQVYIPDKDLRDFQEILGSI